MSDSERKTNPIQNRLHTFKIILKIVCNHEGCTTKASFGSVQYAPIFCFEHKDPDMYDVTRTNCFREGCNEKTAPLPHPRRTGCSKWEYYCWRHKKYPG